MPRPKTIGRTETFLQLRGRGAALGENKDCTVIAIAASCGVDYTVAHAAMAQAGRQKGKGAYNCAMRLAIESLGFKIREYQWYSNIPVASIQKNFIARYPKPHCDVLKNVTTHHPERFRAAWRDGKNYLLFSSRHVSAVVNGELHDWAVGRALRIEQIWEVYK